MWTFTVYKDASDSYRWRLKSGNGRITADSGESYTTRWSARQAAERARQHIAGAAIEDE
ncbi:MAG: YegP family protein [Polyangiaceae bacterium]|nr:YegP family protein [Polyangiaceae bacterium]